MLSRSPPFQDDRLPPAVLLYERRGLWHLALRDWWYRSFARRGDAPAPVWMRFGRMSEARSLASLRPGSFFIIEVIPGWETKVAEEIAHLRRWHPRAKVAAVSQRAKELEVFFREIGAAAVADRVGHAGPLAALIYSHFRSLPGDMLNPWALAWDSIPWREFSSTKGMEDFRRQEPTAIKGEETE
ncbi:MAG: hypothetical protein GYA33_15740 [Thermogutta sp.]|nr:hypothetical protein [Thermogutta sp.]